VLDYACKDEFIYIVDRVYDSSKVMMMVLFITEHIYLLKDFAIAYILTNKNLKKIIKHKRVVT